MKSYRTEVLKGIQTVPKFNYKKQHSYMELTQDLINYFTGGTVLNRCLYYTSYALKYMGMNKIDR